MNREEYELRHRKIVLPCVRIEADKARGSGTILYSAPAEGEKNAYSTYVLTNHHVVEGNIKVEKKWSGLLKMERKLESFELVDVQMFAYRWEQRAIGGTSIQSDIVAYDADEDLALLQLRSPNAIATIAELYPRGQERLLIPGMKVITIGAGLGYEPVQTEGILSQFGQDIDRKEYWLSTAPTIFGNSGGAVFLKETYQFIGVPARIAVQGGWFGADPITHLSWCVPITRVYDFLETQRFRFIYDPSLTEVGETMERERIREEADKKLLAADLAS